MIHLLLRLIIRLHCFSVSKNKWCALHNLKCTNILSIWLLKRLSDTSEFMKAQTHWLPHWKACLRKAGKCNSGCRTLHYTTLSKGTSASVPFYRFSMLIATTEWNLELPRTNHSRGTFSCPKWVRFTFLSSTLPTCPSTVSYRGSASASNSNRVAPRLCSLPKHSFF